MKVNKILFVSHEAFVGGSSISLLNLIEGMKIIDEDIEVTILLPMTFRKNKPAQNLFQEKNVKIKQMLYRDNCKMIGKKRSLKSYIYDILNCFAVYTIKRYIIKNKFDVVCSNSSAVDVGARAALAIKVPHIFYIRELMSPEHGIEYRNKGRMKKLLEKSDCTIFISKIVEKRYTDTYKLKNIVQFYDGFSVDDYLVDNHIIFQNHIIRLIQIGLYSDGKGTLDSIRMIHLLKQNGINNIHLEFVGSGSDEYRNKMITHINQYNLHDNITISAYTNNVKEKLTQSDILLMNSRAEGFGRVTVEGMLAGCLVLGRNEAGTIEIVENGINGLLYNCDKEFLNSIRDILGNRDYYRGIARIGQEKALRKFDCSKAAQNFIDTITGRFYES